MLQNSWHLSIARKSVQNELLQTMRMTKKMVFGTLFLFTSVTLFLLPIFGDIDAILPYKKIYTMHFGTYGIIPYYFGWIVVSYVTGFSLIRHCYMLWYVIAHVRLQMSLVNEQLLAIDRSYDGLEDHIVENSTKYQNEVYKNLHLCIRHYILMTKLLH